MKLSGYICACNVVKFDYCLELAARSLMPVVDELVLCDNGSADETPELMIRLAKEHPNVRIIQYHSPVPTEGRITWMVEWLNWVRPQLSHEMQITLDADEVLATDGGCHAAIREALSRSQIDGCRWFNRLNFWKDAYHTIPDGVVCGRLVARMGGVNLWMPVDEPHAADDTIRRLAKHDSRLRIFHLGFIRKSQAFWDKAKIVQRSFFGSYDPRIDTAESEGKTLEQVDWGFDDKLIPYSGDYPTGVREWLVERGRL